MNLAPGEGHPGHENGHREADARGAAYHQQLAATHALREGETQLRAQVGEGPDAHGLAQNERHRHHPGDGSHRGERHAGIEQPEEAQDDLHRVLPPVLEGAEGVVALEGLPVKEASIEVTVGHDGDDGQEPQGRVEVGLVEAEPGE